MKKLICIAVVMMMACATTVSAQRQRMSAEEIAQRRAEMIQRQGERLAKDMKLDDETKKAFMEEYTKYQQELQEVQGDNQQRRNRDEQVDPEKMSDEECYAKITESLKQQETAIDQMQKRMDITKKYLAAFMGSGKYTAQQLYVIFAQQRQRGGSGQQGGQGFGGQRMGGQGGFGGGNGMGGGRGGFGGGF